MTKHFWQNQGHSWVDLEDDFQTVADGYAVGDMNSADVADARVRIGERARQRAISQFRRWNFRSAVEEGEDAAQEWEIVMHSKLYPLWDRKLSIHPVAFVVLLRVCSNASRRARRFFTMPQVEDVASNEPTPQEVLIQEEIRSLYAAAKEQLRERWRTALDRKQGLPGRHFSDDGFASSDPRWDHNDLYRAKEWLKGKFDDYRSLDN